MRGAIEPPKGGCRSKNVFFEIPFSCNKLKFLCTFDKTLRIFRAFVLSSTSVAHIGEKRSLASLFIEIQPIFFSVSTFCFWKSDSELVQSECFLKHLYCYLWVACSKKGARKAQLETKRPF